MPISRALQLALLELFGGFPAAMDRHVTEFFPQFFRAGRLL